MTKKKQRKRNKKYSEYYDNLTLLEYIRYRKKTKNYGYNLYDPKSKPTWRVRNCIWYKVEKVLFFNAVLFMLFGGILCTYFYGERIIKEFNYLKIRRNLETVEGVVVDKAKKPFKYYGKGSQRRPVTRTVWFSYEVNDSIYNGAYDLDNEIAKDLYKGQVILIDYEKDNPSNCMITPKQFR